MIPVVLTPRPLAEPDTLLQPAGRTVRAMLVDAVAQGRIEAKYLGQAELHIDGAVIPRDQALDHVLEEGQIVNLVVYPHGGGGGGGKDVGQILLQVAVIAVSMWVGGGAGGAISSTFWARVAAAAVMVAGNMAISAIYAPKPAPAEKANDRYALQSASNRYRQWGMAPLMLGTCVVAPDLAVKTFTRAIGDDVWIYGILAHHYGPCQIDELKIGDTLVSSMGASDVKFVHHLTPGPRTFTLVPNDIDQLDLAPEELTATPTTATPVVRASASEGETFELDFYLPGGLYFQKDDGRKIAASVTVTVRYRQVDQFGDPVGSGAWTNGLTIPLTGSSKDPLRITRSLNLPMGRYEFECRRSVLEDTNEKRHTDVAWSAIRAIAYRKPVTDEVLSISEFAIRATALNQGNLAPITCKITPLCQTWTGTEWGPPVPTSNPAALTRWLLTGPAPAKPLLSPQADQGLRAWSALCDEYGWEAHVPIQEDRTQAEALALLERAGRAGVFWDGTQAVASPWVEKPAPKQMFTGVNLKDHRFEIAYADPVHAFRVEFQNLEQRGEADEIMVYNDGYAETAGVDDNGDPVAAATLIEALRLEDGQKTPERAYRDARWEFGRRKHQRRFDTWSADVEAVVCRYGDRVRLAWSRAGGEGGARVRARRWSAGDGSNVTGLRLDREVEMSPGVDYVVDLRLFDQLLTGVPVVNPAVDGPVQTREIVFVDARAAAVSPRRGDMIAFGPVEQVTEDVEILGLEPGEGLTANLTGVRYVAPLLMAGETGPIPELQTRLSLDRLKDPPRPTLLGVQVSADGVRAGFSLPPWKGSPVTAFTVRWRIKPEAGEQSSWLPLPDLPGDAMTLTTPPLRELPGEDEATRVEIEIRAVTAAGQTSPALTFTAVLPVVGAPAEPAWTVTPRPTAADGTSQPVLVVQGTAPSEDVARVAISYGLSASGPWDGSYDGPAGTVSHEIKGLVGNVEYWVLILQYSAQGVPGQPLVIGPRLTPSLTAGDLSPGSPVVKRIDDIVVDVQGLIATYGQTSAAAVSAAAADTARALAETAKQGAIDAKNESAAQAVASQTARQGSETAAAASQSSAQTASTKADEAGQKASAAEVARAAAATERALAESARTTAVAAAETATDASAQAEQAYELAAKTGALRPNLAINGGLEDGLTGLNGAGAVLYIEDSASWGRTLRVTPDGRATYIVLWPTIKHQPGAQITISGDSLMFADSGAAYFDLEALDATGNVLAGGDGPQSPVVGAHDFSDDPNRIQQHASSWTPPAGTVDLRPRGIFESVVNPTALGFRRLKVEQGGLPATAYTAERQVAETVARQKVEEAVRASQTAALATRQSLMEAQASAPANEFDGADMSQGVRPFPQRWSGPDNIPVTRGLNADGSLFVLKTGNGNEWAGVGLLMGSISLAGGPHNQIAGAPGAWRVFAGERIGIAADVRASSNTSTTMVLVPRYYNDAGEQISDLAQIRGQNFNGTYERVGAVIDVPGNGYIQIEAYLLRQGYQQGQYADAHIRKLTFARLAPSATSLPIYGAPGGGVMAARLTGAEGVLATVEGRQQAWLQRRVIAGSAEAFAEMMALDENGVPTSAVNAGARRIGLWNPVDGGWIEVVSVADGRAKIDGAVDINVGTNAVTIRSAATGARIEMTGSRLSMYDG